MARRFTRDQPYDPFLKERWADGLQEDALTPKSQWTGGEGIQLFNRFDL